MRYDLSVVDLLDRVEDELRALDYWQTEPPDPASLASAMPFCHDTLSLPQWLQWVFIPRLRQMIATDQSPPARCEILPAAEMYFDAESDGVGKLMDLIALLDAAMPGPVQN